MTRRGTDDPELQLALGHEVDHRLCVVHLERDADARALLLELAEEDRDGDGGWAGRSPDRELAGERAVGPAEATSSSICSSSWSSRWAPRNSRKPASVGSTLRPERSSSCLPSRFSRARTCSETAGWVTPSRSAAWEKIRSGDEGLDRHDELAARPVLPPARRAARAAGHEVPVSARHFAQTLELLEDAGIDHTVVGPPHGGAGRAGKIRAMASRLRALRSWARPQPLRPRALPRFPRAAARGSLARGSPSYAYDYEFARAQHTLGSRAATRVVVPTRSRRIGSTRSARGPKVRRYPG